MKTHRIGILLLLGALAACSVRPDGSNGARRDFELPGIGYQQAYRNALLFARTCHTGGGIFKHATITNELYDDTQKAAVHVAWGGGTMPEQIDIAQVAKGSRITVVVVGHGMWDLKELDAAQRSIESGTPLCR